MKWDAMWKGGSGDVQQPSLSHASRRWPFIAVLLSVFLLGSSPWLMPSLYDFQKTGSHLDSTPVEMTYNPFGANFTYERAVEVLKCTNQGWHETSYPGVPSPSSSLGANECPLYFQLIQQDLATWKETGIERISVEQAWEPSAFRVIILDSKLYIDRHTTCFGNRAVMTVWGLLLFLKKFHGQVLDLEMMFNCEDRPRVPKAAQWPNGPIALFGYNSNSDHFDIPFPDWSFWGWSELMISSWDEKRDKIINGSHQMNWEDKIPRTFWGGNPWVGAPHRTELLKCNNARLTEIETQDWRKELAVNKQNSKLEDKCRHRYMIYTEGIGWSVSLKYILACGAPTMMIAPTFYDFFSRGLQEGVHYIPIRPSELRAPEMCELLDKAVEAGEANQTEAIRLGKAVQDFATHEIGMESVYNYMFHLLRGYAKLLKFKPVQGQAHLVTLDQMQCITEPYDRSVLQQAMKVLPSNTVPCNMSTSPENGFKGYDWEVKLPGPR